MSEPCEEPCACVADHSPNVLFPQVHHIVPLAYVRAGATPMVPPTVPLCGTAHDNVHELLNEYVRHEGFPPWDDHLCGKKPRPGRKRFNPYIRYLAAIAWAHRPSDRPPYTTSFTSQEV